MTQPFSFAQRGNNMTLGTVPQAGGRCNPPPIAVAASRCDANTCGATPRSRDSARRPDRREAHTVARIAIENNRPIFWLSKHLGHSTLEVTSNVYGPFEIATRMREAQAMAGLFGV